VVVAPPFLPTLAIVPLPVSLQNTRVASTATSVGDVSPVAIQRLAWSTHAEATQTCEEPQACPHAPQFSESVCVVTHAPRQFVHPGSHCVSHPLAVQSAFPLLGAAQVIPHSEQFAGESAGTAHPPPPHEACDGEQVSTAATQLPFEHIWPLLQAVPHVPQ
jgi:hypothetical protein